MRQGIQDSKDLLPQIQRYGCYFLCINEAVLRDLFNIDRDFPHEVRINDIYQKVLGLDFIDEECFVKSPVGVARYAYRYFSGQIGDYHSASLSAPPLWKWRIVYQKKPGYGHFTLEYEGEKWDPLDPERAAAKNYKVDSYRYIY